MGYNFPQTKTFEAVTRIPRLLTARASASVCCWRWRAWRALWMFLFRTRAGFAQQVGGLAPAARVRRVFVAQGACGRRC
jgi:ABC-type uncharacterized transport system permease subunit